MAEIVIQKMHLCKEYFTALILKATKAETQRFHDVKPGGRVLAGTHLPTSPWPFVPFQRSPVLWARHLIHRLLQHFPFLPGSKFKSQWLAPWSSVICRLECRGPQPHSYKCVFWAYSLNFAPTASHLHQVLLFFPPCTSGWNRLLLRPTCQAALEAQTNQLLLMRTIWRRCPGLL